MAMSYENFKRMVEVFDAELQKKYEGTGLKAPKLKVKDRTKTINVNLADYIVDSLREASATTGLSQREIVERCLQHSLNKIIHQHNKTVSYWKR